MFIAAFVTISIRMQLSHREHEVEKAKEAMENLEAQKSGFMRLVSHELRSPIAAIQSSLGVVMNLGADCLDDSLRASLERAMNRAEDLFNLTKDLLEYSRLTSLGPSDKKDLTDVDFTQIVKNVAGLYANQAKDKQIDFKVETPETPLMLFGDPRSLDQIVTNLVANAIQYTPKGGKVSVKLEEIEGMCRLIVSDTGIGIPEKDIEKIGTEFYRSPNAKQFAPSGTGIGMTIVKEALRQHRGSMEIKSKKGEGTTIKVDIPLTKTESGKKF
jgi:two-component system phosphate regulon sensor histidine kinase PhoR